MKEDVLVSVIIPSYNRAGFIGRAIRSVLLQSLTNFEIIVIDDGSNDDTRSVVRSFADDRVRYFYQPNRGPGAARNAGIAQARGIYIAYLDSDDELLPGHLEEMTRLLEKDTSIDWAFCMHETVTDEGQKAWRPQVEEFNKSAIATKKYTTFCGIVSMDIVHRKSCLQKTGGFPEEQLFEDWHLWIKLFEHCPGRYLNKTLGRYYLHKENITRTISMGRTYVRFVLQYLKDHDYHLPYDDYLLDTIKVLTVFAPGEAPLSKELIAAYEQFFPGNPAVQLAAAHAAFYSGEMPVCRDYCEKALAIMCKPVTPYEKNLYFLAHHLISSSCMAESSYLSAVQSHHHLQDYAILQDYYLRINMKLLRYFGGMFFPIAMRLIRGYNKNNVVKD